MSLVLEIEYLLGVAFAARSPASEVADWPPQPDRVFSALVASWAARGERIEEREALQWLEAQREPEISAAGGFPRTAPTVFVPPNDPQTRRVADPAVMPMFRSRQARRFPAYRPDNPIVHVVWRDAAAADAATLAALNALAGDISYLGHSSSLARCRFRFDDGAVSGIRASRRVYHGRLAELEAAYQAGRRPSSGDSVVPTAVPSAPSVAGMFSDRWLVLERVDGEMPDIRAAALIARTLHQTVMAGYERIGLGDAIPAVISGHEPNGAPLAEPHLAVAPMAFLGPRHADGTVFGYALIPPRQVDLLTEPEFQRALREVMPWNDQTERRELALAGEGFRTVFALAGETARRSLESTPYVADATGWATCTPVVLDRHLKEKGNAARQAEIEDLLRRACTNIGLPEPERVVADKHSAIAGAPSAYPSGSAPRWAGWRLPPSLASRQLTHAVLEFSHPVPGPVILGAGRFVGLGMCRALDPRDRRV
jgi:CRISPR-associated protein Csb2